MCMQHNSAAHLDLYSTKIAHPRHALQIAKIQTCQKLRYMYTAYLVRHFSGLKICRYIHKHVCVYIHTHTYIHTYEAYSESEYCFAVKKNQVRFRIKFYCYQILHSSNYFSTYSPPLLRHLSQQGTSFVCDVSHFCTAFFRSSSL